jgi:hypothetical protein
MLKPNEHWGLPVAKLYVRNPGHQVTMFKQGPAADDATQVGPMSCRFLLVTRG